MFQIFTDFATWLVYQRLNLSPATKLGDALHFFVEDVSKIFVLLLVLIYFVAMLRASLDVGRVRDYLAGKHRGWGIYWDPASVPLPRSAPAQVSRYFWDLLRLVFPSELPWPFSSPPHLSMKSPSCFWSACSDGGSRSFILLSEWLLV